MTEICHDCGNEYEVVAQHWSMSDCSHPRLTETQQEILTGILMGDGCCTTVSRNPLITVSMTSPEYLSYVDDMFPVIGNGVSLSMSAEQSAQNKRKHYDNVNEDEYNDVYEWRTKANPNLNQYQNWYKSGKKVFPNEIELTPTVLKHWYCGDGHTQKIGNYYKASIATVCERNNVEKIENMFQNTQLPQPDWWTNHEMHWTKENSTKIFEYMGEPLPDFQYKWPNN
jgi:hypothetical protein